MIKYPLYFHAKAKALSGMDAPIEGHVGNHPSIQCAIPKEFGGKGEAYSPEDLYILAIVTCFIATFKVFAEKAQLVFTEMEGDAKLTMNRNAQGIAELQKVDLTFTLKGVQDQKKAETILTEAQKYCLVSNASKSEKTFSYKFA